MASEQMSADEALARRLQEQFNLESQDAHQSPTTGQHSPYLDSRSGPAGEQDPLSFSGKSLGSPEKGIYQDLDPMQAAAPLHTIDYAEDLPALQAFATQVSQVGCAACKKTLLHSGITPQEITKPWFEKKAMGSNSAIKCTSCSFNMYTCIGCGTASADVTVKRTKSQDWSLAWCCDQGRLFIIWVLLCIFDQHYLNSTSRSKSKVLGSLMALRPVHSSSSKEGTGYGRSTDSSVSSWHGRLASSGLASGTSPDAIDKITAQVTNFLEMVWPGSPQSITGSFDEQPPSLLLTMVSNSFLLERTATLLRNDSLDDIVKRADLYDKVLSWVGAVASHAFTANLVVDDRIMKANDLGLLQTSFSKTVSNVKEKERGESSPSIAKCLENLSTQSRTFVDSLGRSNVGNLEAAGDMLKICRGILVVADLLNKFMPIRVVTPRNPANAWEQWQRDKAVSDVPDHEMMSQHVWGHQARILIHSPKNRIPRIMGELANLKTSLPPGIFVRHAIGRVDVWKVLIIGPLNTPYENGLFEFDVFFPGNYPQEPPRFYFVVGGRYGLGINPNLHADGKVCLSLLNTWPGPRWDPRHSTPLQILVSIQAMIFCEEPWYNEPGREDPRITRDVRPAPISNRYTSKVRVQTVQYCMLPWLQAQGIWGEIVAKHFRTNKQQILGTTQRWAQEEAQWSGQQMAGHSLGYSPLGPTGLGNMGMSTMGEPMYKSMRPLREMAKELQQLLSMI